MVNPLGRCLAVRLRATWIAFPECSKEPVMLNLVVYLQNYLAYQLRRDDRGVTSVEYALIIVGVAVAIFATLGLLAGSINGAFNAVRADL
jgi:Flp pilus assembly pilin Flp